MKKKYVISLAVVVGVLCSLGVTAMVSNANESEVRKYKDKHGNNVIEYVNPVDPGNEPAAPVEEHPLSMGQVQGDVMTIEETPVVEESTDQGYPVPHNDTVENSDNSSAANTENSVAITQIEPSEEGIVPDVATNVRYYTDKYGNKVMEYINPVDPGNQPATVPNYIPSTEGNIQGDIMTLDEPIID